MARVAVTRSRDGGVRALAGALGSGHPVHVADLAPGGAAAPDTYAREIRATGEHDARTLAQMPEGPAFDSAYVASQIAAHERALALLARLPSPPASFVADVRAHLERARALQRRGP